MAQKIDLKEIQRKAYTSYHQDGLLDIFISVYLLGFSIGILLDFLWDFSFGVILPGILVAVVLPIWIAAKRKITMPRIGYVNFGTKGKPKLAAILVGLVSLGGAFFLVFALFPKSTPWFDFIISNGLLFVGIGGLIISSLFGYAMGLNRLYAYGVLAFALFAAGHFLGIFFAYIIVTLGIAVMVTGVALLIRFVNKYPLKGEQTLAQ